MAEKEGWLGRLTPAMKPMRSRSDCRVRPAARRRPRFTAVVRLIVASLLTTPVANVGRAASIERLADGRVAITMLGERLTLNEQDAAGVRRFFYQTLECDGHDTYKFQSWLTDPKLAACLNAGIPNDAPKSNDVVSMTIDTKLAVSRPNQVREIYINVGRVVNQCESWDYGRPPTPPSWTPGPLGYEQRHVQEGTLYRLAAGVRLGAATRSSCNHCTYYCNLLLYDVNKNAGVYVSLDGSDKLTPLPSWAIVDLAARAFADSIFSARPAGDLQ